MKKEIFDKLKKEVIIETNRIRRNPKSYIPILERYLKNFDGNILNKPEQKESIETIEGPRAYREAIEFLKYQKPINPIEYDEEVSKIAEDYIEILGKEDKEDNKEEKVEDSNIDERAAKYLEWDFEVSENIDYGGTTGEEVMVTFLVDDGVFGRSHRDNLFNIRYNYFGVAVGPHPEYEFCTVINYFVDILSYKDKEKDKILQEKRAKLKENPQEKKYFPRTKRGLPFIKNNIYGSKTYKQFDQKGELVQHYPSNKTYDRKSLASEYEEYEELNNNENLISNDPDVPSGWIKKKTEYHKKKFPNKTLTMTVKTYTLEDGSQETVAIDEITYDD